MLWPTLIDASVTVEETGKDGMPVVKAKYSGLHALRHFYASWCINRKAMTLDTYGHLFPRGDDGKQLAETELRLIG
jgi:integrase